MQCVWKCLYFFLCMCTWLVHAIEFSMSGVNLKKVSSSCILLEKKWVTRLIKEKRGKPDAKGANSPLATSMPNHQRLSPKENRSTLRPPSALQQSSDAAWPIQGGVKESRLASREHGRRQARNTTPSHRKTPLSVKGKRKPQLWEEPKWAALTMSGINLKRRKWPTEGHHNLCGGEK